jgi:hypothetical protein
MSCQHSGLDLCEACSELVGRALQRKTYLISLLLHILEARILYPLLEVLCDSHGPAELLTGFYQPILPLDETRCLVRGIIVAENTYSRLDGLEPAARRERRVCGREEAGVV